MKKNVAGQKIGVQMVSATDGSAFTGAVTVSVTGDAGVQATGSVGAGACTHEGNGYHTYAPAQAETNYDLIGFTFTGSGAVPVTVQVFTNFPQTGDAFTRLGAPIAASISADIQVIDDFVDTEIAAIKTQTDKLTFTVANQIDANVLDWKSATAPAMTGDAFARLGAPAGASVSADVAAVQADTDNLQTRVPASLVSGRMDSSVGAMAADVLTAAAIQADAIGSSELAASAVTEIQSGLSTLDASGVRAAVGLASANLDTQLTTIDDFLDTEIAAIKAKTDNLPANPASQTNLDVAVSTRLATAGYTAPDNAGIATINAAVDTEVAAIKAKTDNLPSDPADASDIATSLAAILSAVTGVPTALLDLSNGVETSLTLRQALRLLIAAEAGKLSGAATTTITIRNYGDSKDRIVATVDSNGNRSALTYDLT